MRWLRRLTQPIFHCYFWLTSRRRPQWLRFDFYWTLALFPFHWLAAKWQQQRMRDLLLGIPGLAGIIAVPVFLGTAQLQERSLSAAYYKEGELALSREDYPRAQLLLNRVLKRNDAEVSDAQYAMAVLLEEIGQKDRAAELFGLLAPDTEIGNRAAHRRMSVLLSEALTENSTPQDIQRLYWHLTASADEISPRMSMAWGRYSLAIQDFNKAKRFFEAAVSEFPELWQTLGALEIAQGNNSAAITYFERSSDYLSSELRDAPKNDRIRVDYATVLLKLGRLEKARIVLEQGKLTNPDGPWLFLLASLAVNYHDLMAKEGKPISELLGYIDRALTYDPNHGGALNRLMGYAEATTNGNVELHTILARVIAEAEQPALAHLAMGNLCWLEDHRDQALFHFERALELRSDMSPLLNNMAYLIATDEKKRDLERALALVNTALADRPDDARFLDTRGTIHYLGEDWKSALTDLERAVPGVRDKKAIHRKLATIYDKLGMQAIADEHRKLAE